MFGQVIVALTMVALPGGEAMMRGGSLREIEESDEVG